MLDRKYKLVIFDWDGTLMDSIDKIVSCMSIAAQLNDIEIPSAEAVKNIIGLSLPTAVSQLFPENERLHCELIKAYQSQYKIHDTTETPLFEGVENVLKQLKMNGYQLAVATGKSRNGLTRLLNLTQLTDYFVITKTADDAESKPSADMLEQILAETNVVAKDAIMIGDTYLDMKMAHNINMDAIGVSFGAGKKKDLLTYKPIAVVNAFNELLDYL